MDKINKDIILLLIKLKQASILPEEMERLLQWANKNEYNQAVFQKVQTKEAYCDWLKKVEDIDLEDAWHTFTLKTQKKKRLAFYTPRIAMIAAFLLLAIGFIYFWNSQKPLDGQNEESKDLTEYSQKTELKLSNGERIDLDNTEQSIQEDGGAIINKRPSLLSYISNHNSEAKELINEISVKKGGFYKLQLSDGTMVWLNSMSTLRFPVNFTGDFRQVELDGEAYFEVKHHPTKPFKVHTAFHDLQVLGTAFNLSCYANDPFVKTTLLEGSVRIQFNHDSIHTFTDMIPDQQFLYNKQSKQGNTVELVASEQIAWVSGNFQFNGETLEQIFNILERHYDLEPNFINEDHKQECFTGTLPKYQDVSLILNLMEKVSDVHFDIDGKRVLIK